MSKFGDTNMIYQLKYINKPNILQTHVILNRTLNVAIDYTAILFNFGVWKMHGITCAHFWKIKDKVQSAQ